MKRPGGLCCFCCKHNVFFINSVQNIAVAAARVIFDLLNQPEPRCGCSVDVFSVPRQPAGQPARQPARSALWLQRGTCLEQADKQPASQPASQSASQQVRMPLRLQRRACVSPSSGRTSLWANQASLAKLVDVY